MTFFTKELRDRLEEKRRNAGDLDSRLELEEKDRKAAEQAKLYEHQVRRQDKLVGGRTRALARIHAIELLDSQDRRSGAFPVADTWRIVGLTDSQQRALASLVQKHLPSASPRPPSSRDLAEASATLCAVAFIDEILASFAALAPATTVVRQQIGNREELQMEVVAENPASFILEEIDRKGMASWRPLALSFLASRGLPSPLDPLLLPAVRADLLAAPVSNPISQRFGSAELPLSPAPSATVPFRSKFISASKMWDPFHQAAKPPPPFSQGSKIPLDTHFVSRRSASELHWCPGRSAGCGLPHIAQLGHVLGKGQFTVFLARWGDTLVAAKLFPRSADVGAAFLNELQMLSKVGNTHPGVVGLHAASVTPPFYHFLMRFMGGGCLYDLLHVAKHRAYPLPFDLPRALRVLHGVASGLSYLHNECGIVHRDIKTLNVLVDNDGRVGICDFGVSAFMKRTESAVADVQVGTPVYMAPEIIRRRRYTQTADLYSFGVLAVELLAVEEPFAAEVAQHGWEAVIQMVARDGKRPEIPKSAPEPLRALIADLLKDDTNRPRAEEALGRIFKIATDLSVDLSVPPFPSTPSPSYFQSGASDAPESNEVIPIPINPPSTLSTPKPAPANPILSTKEIIPANATPSTNSNISTKESNPTNATISTIPTIPTKEKNISTNSTKTKETSPSTSVAVAPLPSILHTPPSTLSKVVNTPPSIPSIVHSASIPPPSPTSSSTPSSSTPSSSTPSSSTPSSSTPSSSTPSSSTPSTSGPPLRPAPPPLPAEPSDDSIALVLLERAKLKERGLARLSFVAPETADTPTMRAQPDDGQQTDSESDESSSSSGLSDDDERWASSDPNSGLESPSFANLALRLEECQSTLNPQSQSELIGSLQSMKKTLLGYRSRRAEQFSATRINFEKHRQLRQKIRALEHTLHLLREEMHRQVEGLNNSSAPSHDDMAAGLDALDQVFDLLFVVKESESQSTLEVIHHLQSENSHLKRDVQRLEEENMAMKRMIESFKSENK